jgi:hypothetical protein
MPDGAFQNDTISRRMVRLLLILQLAALVVVLAFSLIGLSLAAVVISVLTFFVLLGVILWLCLRYQTLPIVREKKELERLVLRFQRNHRVEKNAIQECKKERDRLFQAEKHELSATLRTLQRDYVENGLARAFLKEAVIPGIGPKLKERLAGDGIISAAHVSNRIAGLPGFGESKCQALLGWRSSVLARLESTKPAVLTPKQVEMVKQNYQVLHDKNNAAERNAITSQQILEHELLSLKPRLRGFAGVTFPGYLSHSLASRGIVAGLVAFVLIVTQVVSSVSATGSAILASIPTATRAATITTTPTQTPTSSQTLTSTITDTPTISSTATITNAPTLTFTLTSTSTPRPTFTLRPKNTPTLAPPAGGGNDNCHPSYPGVCIPPPPPDLDCKDISYRRFQVLPPDPHNFDRDLDGIGCES